MAGLKKERNGFQCHRSFKLKLNMKADGTTLTKNNYSFTTLLTAVFKSARNICQQVIPPH